METERGAVALEEERDRFPWRQRGHSHFVYVGVYSKSSVFVMKGMSELELLMEEMLRRFEAKVLRTVKARFCFFSHSFPSEQQTADVEDDYKELGKQIKQ